MKRQRKNADIFFKANQNTNVLIYLSLKSEIHKNMVWKTSEYG